MNASGKHVSNSGSVSGGDDPHPEQSVRRQGPEPSAARLATILIHGRGGSAAGILGLTGEIRANDIAFLAPEAAGSEWYPHTFLAPLRDNEPYLSSALRLIERIVSDLERQQVPSERVALVGFSQGACLSLEFAARHPKRYAAVIALSGGLIGPPGGLTKYAGSLSGTPVFLGCSDVDAHIPVERVHESTEIFWKLEARVDERIYPGMGHSVNRDEIQAMNALLAGA